MHRYPRAHVTKRVLVYYSFFNLFVLCLCQNVMEQFNPGLRNLINLGKNYEKAVNGKSFCFSKLIIVKHTKAIQLLLYKFF
jgi:hypothetical protein